MKYRACRSVILFIFLFFSAPLFAGVPSGLGSTNGVEVKIGVLAKRSIEVCRQRWEPLARYLDENIPGCDFTIVPLSFAEIEKTVAERQIDFILTNPSIYINLEEKYHASRILTLIQKCGNYYSRKFGGVLFYRSDRGPFTDIMALRGHTLAVANRNSLGWQALLRELKHRGFLPAIDLKSLQYTDSHDQVVYRVLEGKVDFGVVRTGILEKMDQDGLIDLSKLAVVPFKDPEKQGDDLPFLCSTPTYPEWPLAKLEHTNDYLANRVARTLLFLTPVDDVSVQCQIGGWNTPLSYRSVRELLKELRLPPYEHLGEVSVVQVWEQYYYWIVSLIALLLLLGIAGFILFLAHYRVKLLQRDQERMIEELHRAEARALEQGYLSQELLNVVPMPIFYLDSAGRYLGCNRAFEEFAGHKCIIMQGKPAYSFPVAENLLVIREDDLELLDKRSDRTRQIELVDRKGLKHYFELKISPYCSQDQQPVGLVGVITDLTVYKRLAQKMAQLGAVVEQAAESIVLTDLGGIIQYVNPAFERITGYAAAEVVGRKTSILKSGRHDESFYRTLWETLDRGEIWRGQFVNKRKDGTLYDEDAVIFPIRNEEGKIISLAAVKRDVTQDKILQTQLQTVQRLEAVGQLAAGVAHELNTPIGFVSSNFESLVGYVDNFVNLLDAYRQGFQELAEWLPEDVEEVQKRLLELEKELEIEFILDDMKDLIEESRDGFKRITSIVVKLREFSRIDQVDGRESINLNDAIETTMVVARNEYKYSAEIELELDPDLPEILVNGGEINQVLLNLIVNAAQAIKEQERQEKGKIRIATDFDDEWIRCRVTDDGPGIKPENLERVFDPFFTTKPVGKGTGLGLNISYDIITNKHKGRLLVTSELGKGTTFTIELPRKTGSERQENE
ncbi:MAG: PAS domain S-box protein [Deltaproteobacteria bacterium]|nr:PAS domain S-box protein [Deltaproteobacteria bacterium]